MIKLGSRVKDTVSGFHGIATGRSEFMYGCTRVMIEPEKLHEGKPIEANWFDEQRIEVVEEKKVSISKYSSAKSGGPQRDPRRRSDRP